MILKNIGWAALQQWGQQGSQVIVLFVVAGIVGPESIGVLAFANIFMNLAQMMINQGYSESLIQSEELSEKQINTVFWRMMMIAGGVFVVYSIVGSIIGLLEVGDQFGWVLLALSPIVFLRPMAQMQSSLAAREMRYKEVARVSILASFASDALAVYLALSGWNVWSLVVGQIVKSLLLNLLLNRVNDWVLKFDYDKSSIKNVEKFSRNLFGTNLLAFVGMRGDQLVVGMLLGFESLGLYSLVMRIMITIETLLMSALNRVFFSVFSRMKNESQNMIDVYFSMQNILCAAMFPAIMGLALVGPLLFSNMLGPEWAGSGVVFWPLSVFMVFKTLSYLFYPLQLGQGRSDLLLKSTGIAACFTIILSLLLCPYGINAIALGVALRALLAALLHLRYVNESMVFPNLQFFKGFAVNLFCVLVMVCAGMFVLNGLSADWVGRVAATVLVSVLVYGGLLLVRKKTLMKQISTLSNWSMEGHKVAGTAA